MAPLSHDAMNIITVDKLESGHGEDRKESNPAVTDILHLPPHVHVPMVIDGW